MLEVSAGNAQVSLSNGSHYPAVISEQFSYHSAVVIKKSLHNSLTESLDPIQ